MFKFLNKEFKSLLDKFSSHGKIREEHIKDFLQELKNIFLQADINLEIIEDLTLSIKAKIEKENLVKNIAPEDMMRKILYEEMVNILSQNNIHKEIKLPKKMVNNLLIMGLQGSGKTTASAKIALKFKNEGKKTLLVSLDIYRVAAQEQLKILADSQNIDSLEIIPGESPIKIAKRAVQFAQDHFYEVIIYDTAGRMQVDKKMMEELQDLKNFLIPTESILVIDSMLGQEACNIAESFDKQISIDSFLISRIDGDSKAGSAFTVNYITKKPIKFLSTGENLEDLENFDPKSIISRILNMGNLEELIDKIQKITGDSNNSNSQSKIERMQSGKFDFNDYLQEIQNMNKIGSVSKILSMLPSVGPLKKISEDKEKLHETDLSSYKSIILSMTYKERSNPQILNFSRKKRIALGSGTSIVKLEKLLKKFNKMKLMMKKMSKFSLNHNQ